MDKIKPKIIHKAFGMAILLKGINGLLEIVGGILLLIINSAKISRFVFLLTQHELWEDPNDLLANHLIRVANNFSLSTQLFGSFFLLSHGVIKLFLIISLWKRRPWAYPAAVILFSAFIFYQIYRYSHTHSFGLILLTILDILVIVLTCLEYRNLKRISS